MSDDTQTVAVANRARRNRYIAIGVAVLSLPVLSAVVWFALSNRTPDVMVMLIADAALLVAMGILGLINSMASPRVGFTLVLVWTVAVGVAGVAAAIFVVVYASSHPPDPYMTPAMVLGAEYVALLAIACVCAGLELLGVGLAVALGVVVLRAFARDMKTSAQPPVARGLHQTQPTEWNTKS